MTQTLDLKIKGIYKNPNQLSEVPPGALETADNVVIDKESVAETRRGQTFYGATTLADIIKQFNFRNSLITHYNTNKLAYDSDNAGTWVQYTGTYSPPDTDFKIRSAEANRNFYFTTDDGIKKIDNLTGAILDAGAYKGLDGTGATSGVSGFMADDTAVAYRLVWGYLDANKNLILGVPSQRAIVTNTVGGAATRDVALTFLIPSEITTSWIYQLYRSGASATAADVPNDELQLVYEGTPTAAEIAAGEVDITDQTPNDLRGAYLYTNPSQEGILEANEIPPFAKDIDVYKNHTLYANVRSKNRYTVTLIAVDTPALTYIAETGNTTDTSPIITTIGDTSSMRVGMRVVGTGVPTDATIVTIDSATQITVSADCTVTDAGVSIECQDLLTISKIDYWAGSAEAEATDTFLLDKSGTPAGNIKVTALSIVSVVNRSASTTGVYAYYLSGFDDLPGKMLFEERGIGGDEFSIKSTYGASFNPLLSGHLERDGNYDDTTPKIITSLSATSDLSIGMRVEWSTAFAYIVSIDSSTQVTISANTGTGSGTKTYLFYPLSQESDNEVKLNRIYISKALQPEAVPLQSHVDAGSADAEIRRIIALRDSVFILKDDGIYRMTGDDRGSFRVTLFDSTAIVKAPESAVAFNNQVMTFSDQGVIAIAESGVSAMSRPIENELLELSAFDNFADNTFGISYDSERKYLLFTVTESTDTYSTQAWVYNSFTNAWTRWPMNRVCGIVSKRDNKLYQGHPINDYIYQERKSFSRLDYADEEYAVTITVVSGTSITLSDATSAAVGMTLKQDSFEALITVVTGDVLTIDSEISFNTGAAEVYTPILTKLKWVPVDFKNPGILKQFREAMFIFRDAAFKTIGAVFSTNFSSQTTETTITPLSLGRWGMFPWGGVAWGGVAGGAQVLRTLVPLETQRANWLNIELECEQAFSSFSLAGLSVKANKSDSRVK